MAFEWPVVWHSIVAALKCEHLNNSILNQNMNLKNCVCKMLTLV